MKFLAMVVLAVTTQCVARADGGKSCCLTTECAEKCPAKCNEAVKVGAERTAEYIPFLKGKRVAIMSNHTGMVGNKHTLDVMLEQGVNVTTIFSPEHGFRGNADAGEKVKSSVDATTGIPIASLYEGKSPMPSAETMAKFDVIAIDIQDVGLRYYTYYVTMINLMDAALT